MLQIETKVMDGMREMELSQLGDSVRVFSTKDKFCGKLIGFAVNRNNNEDTNKQRPYYNASLIFSGVDGKSEVEEGDKITQFTLPHDALSSAGITSAAQKKEALGRVFSIKCQEVEERTSRRDNKTKYLAYSWKASEVE
jgi:hypothetical protein